MSKKLRENYKFFEEDIVLSLAPLLSEESYQNLQLELKRVKNNAPPMSGVGVNHLNYVGATREECRKQVVKLQDRLNWIRQVCFFYELLERDARRKAGQLEKDKDKLKEENANLRDEVKRTRHQLQTALGIKKNKSEEEKKGASASKPKDGKKRGSPKGHRGKTRPIPKTVDKTEVIPVPDKCSHCNSSHIIKGDQFINKYIEDIPPVVKTTIQRKFMKGRCADCNRTSYCL